MDDWKRIVLFAGLGFAGIVTLFMFFIINGRPANLSSVADNSTSTSYECSDDQRAAMVTETASLQKQANDVNTQLNDYAASHLTNLVDTPYGKAVDDATTRDLGHQWLQLEDQLQAIQAKFKC